MSTFISQERHVFETCEDFNESWKRGSQRTVEMCLMPTSVFQDIWIDLFSGLFSALGICAAYNFTVNFAESTVVVDCNHKDVFLERERESWSDR